MRFSHITGTDVSREATNNENDESNGAIKAITAMWGEGDCRNNVFRQWHRSMPVAYLPCETRHKDMDGTVTCPWHTLQRQEHLERNSVETQVASSMQQICLRSSNTEMPLTVASGAVYFVSVRSKENYTAE